MKPFTHRLSSAMRVLNAAVRALVLALVLALPARLPGQTYSILHVFGKAVMGLNPAAPLVQGPDGTLYGTASGGGAANWGQVFKVNPDGSGYAALKDFLWTDGASPYAGLVLSGTTLYGTTREGGTNGCGTVFKLQTDGSGFQVLKEFDCLGEGGYVEAGLVLSGTTLFGTTTQGGIEANPGGTVFRLETDGTGFAVLKQFAAADGRVSSGGLALTGNTLYGATHDGGSLQLGTVFALGTDGTGFSVLKEFEGTNGYEPTGALLVDGSTLYGTTSWGGTNNDSGTVFKLSLDGSNFTLLVQFDNLDHPAPGLLLDGTTLYGMTMAGGSNGFGTIFKLDTDGSDFAVLKELSQSDGGYPQAGLVRSNQTLYGMMFGGGAYEYGTVFAIETDGSGFHTILAFAGGDGAAPDGLVLSGANLYGTTLQGGASGSGTLFTLGSGGDNYTIIKDFVLSVDGACPTGKPVVSGTNVYATARAGGPSGSGTTFMVHTDGSGFTVLHEFTNVIDGTVPNETLLLADQALYGTTREGGSFNRGVVFKLNTDGTGYTVLKHFSGDDGSVPARGLVLSGSALYGATASGGTNYNLGTIFSLETNGDNFIVLKRFSGADGANPRDLVLDGASLYGTTDAGGPTPSSVGTVFRLGTDGSGHTVLKNFTGDHEGYAPHALVLSGSTLYGATDGGLVGAGTIFQLNTDGSGFAVLRQFAGAGNGDAGGPQDLALSGTTLFGTALYGGVVNGGVLFSLSPGLPGIVIPPQSQALPVGATYDFQVEATGWPQPTYQWFFNTTNALEGATNSAMELTNIQPAQAGAYTVVVSNSYGSVTSQVATLLVEDPFINNQPRDQAVDAEGVVGYYVDVVATSPCSYQWAKDGAILQDGGNLTGTQTRALVISNAFGADAGGYSVVVSDSAGSITSRVATLRVTDPWIRAQPLSRSVNAGTNVLFSVSAAGTTPNYQWYKNGASLADGGQVSGAQTASLTVSNLLGRDSGDYQVLVSNAFGVVTSEVVTLTVADPFILTQPASQTLRPGQTAAFSVVAGGTGPLAYQWRKDGVALNTATTSSLTIRGAQASDTGVYEVVVSNLVGSVTSAPAGLAVFVPPMSPVLHTFDGSDGSEPYGGLVWSGTALYGTCLGGGASDCGTLFKLNPDGSGFTVLRQFSGSDGKWPLGGLVVANTMLYGAASFGGSDLLGTLFRINTDGTGFGVLNAVEVMHPFRDLILRGTRLYGLGSANAGRIFSVNTDGSDFVIVKEFAGTPDEGFAAFPSSLVLSDGTLYGTTGCGLLDQPTYGTIFKLNSDGSGFSVLKTFASSGSACPGGLLVSGTTLYGTTSYGSSTGRVDWVFKLNTDGSDFTVLRTLSDSDGISPQSRMVLAGATLYGTASSGGDYGHGTVFRLNTDGTGFMVLKSFNGLDGSGPYGDLSLVDHTLYGITSYGGASGHGVVFALPLPEPTVVRAPLSRTAEVGGAAGFNVDAAGAGPLFYQWYLNGTPLTDFTTNAQLQLTGMDFGFAGTYVVVVTNLFGAVTSAPAMLQVITPVERRPVPAMNFYLLAAAESPLHLEYTEALAEPMSWLPLDVLSLTSTSQLYFDLTVPLPPRRFYRAWQTGDSAVGLAVNLPAMVPAITLAGDVGATLRLDCINAIGPTDAWVTLATVTLTNTSQLYFDVSAVNQPPRLYRIVPVP